MPAYAIKNLAIKNLAIKSLTIKNLAIKILTIKNLAIENLTNKNHLPKKKEIQRKLCFHMFWFFGTRIKS